VGDGGAETKYCISRRSNVSVMDIGGEVLILASSKAAHSIQPCISYNTRDLEWSLAGNILVKDS
jgi:hypothetical protein